MARLYDLGDFPGAVRSRVPTERVEGEIYELQDPTSQLKELDLIEEFHPGNPKESLFMREEVEVFLLSGKRMVAWTYFLPKQPREGRLIPSGDYADVRVSRA